MNSADSVRQSTAAESAAISTSLQRGLSLRSLLRHSATTSQCQGKQAVTESESSRVFPLHSAVRSTVIEQSGGIKSMGVRRCKDSETAALCSGLTSSPAVSEVVTRDEDRRLAALQSSLSQATENTAAVESNSLDNHVRVRRRLGMTHQTTRQPTKRHSQGHDHVSVFPCHVECDSTSILPNSKDDSSALPTVSQLPSTLDKSFAKLVVGLNRVPPHPQVNDSEITTQPETQRILQNHHRRHHRTSLERKHTRGRSRRMDRDCGRHRNWSDVHSMDVEDAEDQLRMKDCVVLLERSRSVEKMAKESLAVSETEIFSRPSVSSQTQQITSATMSSSSSVAGSDKRRCKLSLRKSPRTDARSCSLRSSVCLSSSTDENSLVVRNSDSVDFQSNNLPDASACDNLIGRHETHIPVTAAKHRLKRRKVCLQLTTSHDSGSSLGTEDVKNCCIVGQGTTDVDARTSDIADLGKVEVIVSRPDPVLSSPTHVICDSTADEAVLSSTEVTSQPDPDFSPLPTTVKRAKTDIIRSNKADVGQSEVIPQPYLDSQQPLETIDGTDDENRTITGQAEVISRSDLDLTSLATSLKCAVINHAVTGQSEVIAQPDPDLSTLTPVKCVSTVHDKSAVGQAEVVSQSDPDHPQPDPDCPQPLDFSDDRCTDAMYHMALVSSPETSDLDSSPPLPCSPTESFSSDNYSSVRQQTNLCQNIDDDGDDDDDDDDEAVEYVSDTKATLSDIAEPQVRLSGELKMEVVHEAAAMMSSAFAANTLRREDHIQEMDHDAAESVETMMACDVEESLGRSQNITVDLVGQIDVTKTDVGATPKCDKSLRMADCDKSLSRSENMELDDVRHDDVRQNDIGSTPADGCSLKESATLVDSIDESSSFSKTVKFNLTDEVESVGIGKNKISSTPGVMRSLDEAAAVVVLHPESLPPSRHDVISDLASSRRHTLLQSTYDAFCADAGDLPSHPRYVVMLGIYSLIHIM